MQFVMRSILKYKSKISEHGAFPLVSVWVWHGEPGNMHPYNFESLFLLPKALFWAHYCKKPQNYRFQDHPTRIFKCVGRFWNEQGTMPCAENFWDINCAHPKINTLNSEDEGSYPNTCDE